MTHLTEEQLVLYYLGESEELTEARAHLDDCAACRADLAAVQRTLNLMNTWETPERGPEYGTQVWNQLRPRLGIRARFFSFQWFSWTRAASTAAVASYASRGPALNSASSASVNFSRDMGLGPSGWLWAGDRSGRGSCSGV